MRGDFRSEAARFEEIDRAVMADLGLGCGAGTAHGVCGRPAEFRVVAEGETSKLAYCARHCDDLIEWLEMDGTSAARVPV